MKEKITMTIKEELEELFEQDADDFAISKAFKNAIKTYKENLDDTFSKNQGKDFLVKHTKSIDLFISLMYKTVLRKFFGNYLPMSNSIPIAIVALGSYGREQMALYSDIDLMIVYEEIEGYNIQAMIESFLHIAWDAKLDLGHRVHKASELFDASNEDITIKTALLESRLITGSLFTWHTTQHALQIIRKNDPYEFIYEKLQEAHTRRKKYPRSMQPNLKEGVGGLRDANLMFWISFVLYDISNIRDLRGKLFSDEEYKGYRQALEFLFKTRSSLHLIMGKKQDVLILERLPEVASLLGFTDERSFVTKLLYSMHIIDTFSKVTVNKMTRHLFVDYTTSQLKKKRIVKDFYMVDNRLYTRQNDTKISLLSILDVLHKTPDISSLRFNPSVLHKLLLVDVYEPLTMKEHQSIYKLFERDNLYPLLELFYNAQILVKIFEPLKKINFLAQFDGYHKYPVAIHSMKCVKSLENIGDEQIANLYKELSSSDQAFLKLIVFIHDAGKGRVQDHHKVGAKLFTNYAKKINLDEDYIKTGSTLIKYHTFMSSTAFKEDIYHEKVLLKFMSVFTTKKMLDFIYILTYADINGVGPGTYTSFNERLLRELYTQALDVVDQTVLLGEAAKRLKKEASLKKNATFQALPKIRQKKILAIESNLFFIKHSTKDILALASDAIEIEKYRYYIQNTNHLRIQIYRKVPLNIGFLLSKLSYLSIVTMEVFKLYNELKYFRIDFNEKINENEIEIIHSIIEQAFDMEQKFKLPSVVIPENSISIDCNHSKTYASMCLIAPNQKGLLAFIMSKMDKLSINIATAKIHTIKNRAQDSFLIEKMDNLCQNSEIIIKDLIQGN